MTTKELTVILTQTLNNDGTPTSKPQSTNYN